MFNFEFINVYEKIYLGCLKLNRIYGNDHNADFFNICSSIFDFKLNLDLYEKETVLDFLLEACHIDIRICIKKLDKYYN